MLRPGSRLAKRENVNCQDLTPLPNVDLHPLQTFYPPLGQPLPLRARLAFFGLAPITFFLTVAAFLAVVFRVFALFLAMFFPL